VEEEWSGGGKKREKKRSENKESKNTLDCLD
jgi:hypothetical protein